MGFSVDIGLFLCDDEADEDIWPRAERERFLDQINAHLRRLGFPEHREPRTVHEINPPLGPHVDPCALGASMGSYSSHARRVERLDWFARHVAVLGTVPFTDPPYEPGIYQAYDAITDRDRAFDHLLAACGQDTILLPRPFSRVLSNEGEGDYTCLVSAVRLRAEAVALGLVLRYADATGRWVEESELCHKLLACAKDVLRTGAVGHTS